MNRIAISAERPEEFAKKRYSLAAVARFDHSERIGVSDIASSMALKHWDATRILLCATACLLLGMASGNSSTPVQNANASDPASRRAPVTNDDAASKMKVTIGSKAFKAILDDNRTVAKLKALLPLTVKMTELNGNEKYHHFSTGLPTDAIRPGTIQKGDIMLYGDNSLVLFYKTFKTPYRYTRLGRIDDPSGLAAAVGTGDVSVTFELE